MNEYLAARLDRNPSLIARINRWQAATDKLIEQGWHGYCGGPGNCDLAEAQRKTKWSYELHHRDMAA